MQSVSEMLAAGRRTVAQCLTIDKAALARHLARQAAASTNLATRQPKAA